MSPTLGKYELLVELAAGGMATVYVGRQLGAAGFERLVAIKRVHRHLLGNREFYDLFRDEARVSSMIRHANVVSATDVVEASGELFLVMDYVESVSLAALRGDPPAPIAPAIASRIVADMLAGLHAAHEAVDLRGARLDVIHRDVSPQNVVVGSDGVSRLIDFGIAKAAARLADTSHGALRGKLRYMSPEQVKQRPLDRRADVWAAGVVLYEILTGQRLFEGEDEGDIALAILLGGSGPPSRVAPVPPELDAVVARALAQDRAERFPTAAAMQLALERACPPASHQEVASWVRRGAGAELDARSRALRSALETPSARVLSAPLRHDPDARTLTAPGRRARVVAAALTALVVTIGVAAGVAAFRRSSAPVAAASTSATSATPAPSSSADSPPDSQAAPERSASAAAPATSAAEHAPPSSPARRRAPRAKPPDDLHRNPYGR